MRAGFWSQRARTDAPPPPNMVYERSTPDARVAAIDAPALGCSIALLEVPGSGVGGKHRFVSLSRRKKKEPKNAPKKSHRSPGIGAYSESASNRHPPEEK